MLVCATLELSMVLIHYHFKDNLNHGSDFVKMVGYGNKRGETHREVREHV